MKISGYSNSKVFRHGPLEVRGKGHFEVRGKLPPCAIHGMVDQRWKTARDQRRVQRRMLDNIIQAHASWYKNKSLLKGTLATQTLTRRTGHQDLGREPLRNLFLF